MAIDFTFDPNSTPSRAEMMPVYTAILTAGPKPRVCITGADRAAAETWLRAQHQNYAAAVQQRSQLIKNMDLPSRVTLVDAQDFPI
jgi:hypothetical protein